MKRFYFYLLFLVVLFVTPPAVNATDNEFWLGSTTDKTKQPYNEKLLAIQINSKGTYCVYRYLLDRDSKKWISQLYAPDSPLFSIKIGNDDVYLSSSSLSYTYHGQITHNQTLNFINDVEDVSSSVTGTKYEVIKKFSGVHKTRPFSVTMKISYNTSAPDYFIQEASIDVSQILAGTPISFSYGWYTYVNATVQGYAYIMPDPTNLNNSSSVQNKIFTIEQVRQLRLVGSSNSKGDGALIGFFPMGRNFDGAYSSYPFAGGLCFNLPFVNSSGYKFEFGSYTGGNNNSVGVVYHNIPPGEVTEISTGVTFTSALDGELDYTWGDTSSKDYVAEVGDEVNLNLYYKSYSNVDFQDIGFQVNFPGLSIREDGCTPPIGFPSADVVCVPGNNYYKVSNASLEASGNNTSKEAWMTVPVKIMQAGKWMVDGSSISNMSRTLPLGSRATLTVKTGVIFASDTMQYMCPGSSRTLTVRSSSNATVAEDVEVELSYSGDTDAFSSLPATVTIPAGENSASFTIESLLAVPDSTHLTITLSGTNQDFLGIGTITTTQVVMVPLTAGAIGNDQSICSDSRPEPLIQTKGANGGTRAYTYQWQFKTDDNSNWKDVPGEGTGIDYSPESLSETTYYRRAVSDGACGTEYTDSVTITVIPREIPSVELSASPDFSVCEDEEESITFTAISVNGGTKPVYIWKVNGKEVQSGEKATFVLTNLRLYRESTVSCTMVVDTDICTTVPTVTDEKAVRVSSCTIPANPHIRGKVY